MTDLIEPPEPGVYENTSAHVYHNGPGWKSVSSQSIIKKAVQYTPWHARHDQLNPTAPTKAMEKGTALHSLVLEPDTFEDSYLIGPNKTRTSKAWMDMAADNPGITMLTPEELAAVRSMAGNLNDLPEVRLLNNPKMRSRKEVSIVADLSGLYPPMLDAEMSPYTIRCKARIDWWPERVGWNVDLKTCDDAREEKFDWIVYDRGYHIQAAHYERMAAAVGIEIKRHVFILVENKPPFIPVARRLKDVALEKGRATMAAAEAHWAWCMENNQYPGYPPDRFASLPKSKLGDTPYSSWEEELSEAMGEVDR